MPKNNTMTYKEVLSELSEIDLKDKFISEFESIMPNDSMNIIKETDKINSTGSLLRVFLRKLQNESTQWKFWQKVFVYFNTPEFAREKIFVK